MKYNVCYKFYDNNFIKKYIYIRLLILQHLAYIFNDYLLYCLEEYRYYFL